MPSRDRQERRRARLSLGIERKIRLLDIERSAS